MKLILSTIMILLSQIAAGKQKETVISGKINGLKPGTCINLLTIDNEARIHNEFRLRDTLRAVAEDNGKFKFIINPDGDGQLYFLNIQGEKDNCLLLLSIGEDVKIRGEFSEWPIVAVTGSQATTEWYKYKSGFDLLAKEKKEKEMMEYRRKFLDAHPNSLCAAFIIRRSEYLDLEAGRVWYNKLTPYARESYWGKKIKRFIEDADQKKVIIQNLSVGNVVPNFEITNEHGERTNILEVVNKAKYTLIDFWASWCGPCKTAFPKMKEVYKNFEDKGFNIIGVSTDRNKEDWKKAIKEHQLSWDNYIDNIENANKVKFGIVGIPGYILVDRQGKILATSILTSLNGQLETIGSLQVTSDLFKTIAELF